MIVDYGFSITGKGHLDRGIICQDAHKIVRMKNGWVVAAVADGVGSAKNAQIGSRIAAETAADVCNEFMPWDYSVIGIKSMIRTAFNYAFKQIIRESEKTGEPIESFDTTLTLVIYDGRRIIYGHSGDGGIIGLTTFGDYVVITKPQKGVDGVSVIPLRAGYTQWVIDAYDDDLAAVLLMTDGMLEMMCPYLLKEQNCANSNVYVSLAAFFADPVGFSVSEEGLEQVKKAVRDFVVSEEGYCLEEFYARLYSIYMTHCPENGKSIIESVRELNYPVLLMQNVQDDKTIVGLINPDLAVDAKPEEFYSEPAWSDLQLSWNRRAYPSLYAVDEKLGTETPSDKSAESEDEDEAVEESDHIQEQNCELVKKTREALKPAKKNENRKSESEDADEVVKSSMEEAQLSSARADEMTQNGVALKKGLRAIISNFISEV